MGGLNGDFMSLAEAVGEREPEGLCWTADEMAEWDEDDFEAAEAAMDREAAREEQEAGDEWDEVDDEIYASERPCPGCHAEGRCLRPTNCEWYDEAYG